MRSAPHAFARAIWVVHRIHEQADAHPPPPVARDARGHAPGALGVGEIPAVVRGELGVGVRHQRRLVGARRLDEAVEPGIAVLPGTRGGVALDVELDLRMLAGQEPGQGLDVGG